MMHRIPIAATLVLLAACQSDRESSTNAPASAPPAPAKTAQSVPAAPIIPAKAEATAAAKPTEAPAVLDTSPAGRFATVKKEQEAAMNAYYAHFEGAKSQADFDAIAKTVTKPDVTEFRARARAIVDENPADPVALDAITWLLTDATDEHQTDQKELLAIVEKYHLDSDKLTPLVRAMANDPSADAQAFVAVVMEKSPSNDMRGTASYALAGAKLRELDTIKRLQSPKADEDAEYMTKRYGAERVAAMKAADPVATRKQAEAMLERTAREFGDVKSGKSTLGARANGDLFEMHNLIVGKVAPDIAGEDLDGTNFKLADYRGKIVMLDFWGNW